MLLFVLPPTPPPSGNSGMLFKLITKLVYITYTDFNLEVVGGKNNHCYRDGDGVHAV